jgi:hypothetical protein
MFAPDPDWKVEGLMVLMAACLTYLWCVLCATGGVR